VILSTSPPSSGKRRPAVVVRSAFRVRMIHQYEGRRAAGKPLSFVDDDLVLRKLFHVL
jgi:hypothetical protein